MGDATWSSGTDPMAFLGGYGQQMGHDSYNIDGMFGPGGFNGFSQPGFGYSFAGSGGEYAWGNSGMGSSAMGGRSKHYEDYYRDSMYGGHDDRSGMKAVDQGMQGLNIGQEKDKNIKIDGTGKPEMDKEQVMTMVQSQKKMTWASIASQPPKPASKTKKNSGGGGSGTSGAGGKHLDIGTWESKNGGPKTVPPPIVPRPAWNSNRGRSGPGAQYNGAASQGGPQPHVQSAGSSNQQQMNSSSQAASHPVLDELKVRNEYNPKDFDVNQKNVQFYVIKSYSEDDIHRSIKYEIWCSTEHGNKRLDQSFRASEGKGPIYLFFSVNGSRHFCGMAQMVSPVDYSNSSNVWAQDKWKGQFKVKWIFVKDVPNAQLRHIRLENNENKPVTNSRDTQLVPVDKGKQVLKIMMAYEHKTSIFDDFVHYEKRQEEEEVRGEEEQPGGGSGSPQENTTPVKASIIYVEKKLRFKFFLPIGMGIGFLRENLYVKKWCKKKKTSFMLKNVEKKT